MTSKHGVHNSNQTAFRFPPGVLPRLKARAEAEGRTMTAIVVGLVTGYLDGITTSGARAQAQPADSDCPHPKARINKGLCGACGTYVGTTSGGK
jgi:hypothetical protein